jgi:hypothetical protein
MRDQVWWVVPCHIARAPLNICTNKQRRCPSDIAPSGTERVIQGTVWFHRTGETRDGDVDHWVMK